MEGKRPVSSPGLQSIPGADSCFRLEQPFRDDACHAPLPHFKQPALVIRLLAPQKMRRSKKTKPMRNVWSSFFPTSFWPPRFLHKANKWTKVVQETLIKLEKQSWEAWRNLPAMINRGRNLSRTSRSRD